MVVLVIEPELRLFDSSVIIRDGLSGIKSELATNRVREWGNQLLRYEVSFSNSVNVRQQSNAVPTGSCPHREKNYKNRDNYYR